LERSCEKCRGYRVKEDSNILYKVKSRKADWIGHILRRNWLLKILLEERWRNEYKWQEDKEEDISSYWMILRKRQDTRTETGSNRLHPVENLLWKRDGPVVRKTTNWIHELMNMNTYVWKQHGINCERWPHKRGDQSKCVVVMIYFPNY
jgi:hypothetical protein